MKELNELTKRCEYICNILTLKYHLYIVITQLSISLKDKQCQDFSYLEIKSSRTKTDFIFCITINRMPITNQLVTSFLEVDYFRMTQAPILAPQIQMTTEGFS